LEAKRTTPVTPLTSFTEPFQVRQTKQLLHYHRRTQNDKKNNNENDNRLAPEIQSQL